MLFLSGTHIEVQLILRLSELYGNVAVAWLVTIKVFLIMSSLADCELSCFSYVALIGISNVTVHKPAQCYISYDLPGWQSVAAGTWWG